MILMAAIEAWLAERVAFPVFFALIVGLTFGTVIIPEVWRVFRQHLGKEDAVAAAIREQTAMLARQTGAYSDEGQKTLWLNVLRKEYIVSNDNISPALIAGTEWPPVEWMNRRLSELGKPWRLP